MQELNFDNKAHYITSIPEFIRIQEANFVVDIGIVEGDLIFHFFGNKELWKKWSNDEIDKVFTSVFNSPVKDMTGLFEKRVKELAQSSTSVLLKAFNEVKNDPAKIQKSYMEKLPMYEEGKDWDNSKHQQTWSYTVKDCSGNPYIDVLAKKIVDGVQATLV